MMRFWFISRMEFLNLLNIHVNRLHRRRMRRNKMKSKGRTLNITVGEFKTYSVVLLDWFISPLELRLNYLNAEQR